MNDRQLYSIIIAPHVTEKAERQGAKNNLVVLRVAKHATKKSITHAVQKLFSVQVESVQTVFRKGKRKNFKQKEGSRSDWKKAYVTLAEGHAINLAEFA